MTIVTPELLLRADCWATKKQNNNKMRMLRWMREDLEG